MMHDTTTIGGLEVRDVRLALDARRTLLEGVSFTARPGTLTAVIGPSGAGKSTLAAVLAGARRPSAGSVRFAGTQTHTVRSAIGMVPQDDVVHGRLTVGQALGFAAELRMPAGSDRRRAIATVCDDLELTPHTDTRIDALSGGQRTRVSMAVELLTSPDLLILDEPTTGLDPALDRAVMTMLRRLADAGRVVVVVTHSLTFLDVCDQVLLLAPGGKPVFCGPPADVEHVLGSADWAEIFTTVCTDPDGLHHRFLAGRDVPAMPGFARVRLPIEAPRPRVSGQLSPLVRRQVRLLLANRGYVAFLAVLPVIVGLLPLTVAGDAGLSHLPTFGAPPFEAKHLVALTSFAAILLGTTLTARDLLGERAVFLREQAAGLSATAYLLAKTIVFGAIAAAQSAVLVLIVTAPAVGKPGPVGAAALGDPMVELFVGVAATAIAAVVLGLAVSASARSGDQVVVLLAITLMAQLVLAGGFIPVTNRPVMEAMAWFTPGRWGFAATASTADLTHLVAGLAEDALWRHTTSTWLVNLAMLAALSVLCAVITRWRLRRPR